MIQTSKQVAELYTKIFTFGGLAFCLKILPLKEVRFAEVHLELESIGVAIGILATLTAYLVVSVFVLLLRDFLQQVISDSNALAREPPVSEVNFTTPSTYDRKKYVFLIYTVTSYISTTLRAVFPVIFGMLAVIFCYKQILEFYSHALATLT